MTLRTARLTTDGLTLIIQNQKPEHPTVSRRELLFVCLDRATGRPLPDADKPTWPLGRFHSTQQVELYDGAVVLRHGHGLIILRSVNAE